MKLGKILNEIQKEHKPVKMNHSNKEVPQVPQEIHEEIARGVIEEIKKSKPEGN